MLEGVDFDTGSKTEGGYLFGEGTVGREIFGGIESRRRVVREMLELPIGEWCMPSAQALKGRGFTITKVFTEDELRELGGKQIAVREVFELERGKLRAATLERIREVLQIGPEGMLIAAVGEQMPEMAKSIWDEEKRNEAVAKALELLGVRYPGIMKEISLHLGLADGIYRTQKQVAQFMDVEPSKVTNHITFAKKELKSSGQLYDYIKYHGDMDTTLTVAHQELAVKPATNVKRREVVIKPKMPLLESEEKQEDLRESYINVGTGIVEGGPIAFVEMTLNAGDVVYSTQQDRYYILAETGRYRVKNLIPEGKWYMEGIVETEVGTVYVKLVRVDKLLESYRELMKALEGGEPEFNRNDHDSINRTVTYNDNKEAMEKVRRILESHGIDPQAEGQEVRNGIKYDRL